MEALLGRWTFWAGAVPDVLILLDYECIRVGNERGGVSMCLPYRQLSGQSDQIEKKSIRELREEAALKNLWRKACEVVDSVADPLKDPPLFPEELQDKKPKERQSIRELREEAELKNLWHKTCDIVNTTVDLLTQPPLFPEEPKKKPKKREGKEMEFLEAYVK